MSYLHLQTFFTVLPRIGAGVRSYRPRRGRYMPHHGSNVEYYLDDKGQIKRRRK